MYHTLFQLAHLQCCQVVYLQNLNFFHNAIYNHNEI